MGRIRTIKPEFFTSADILELTPLARLFYIALWCEADREGYLNWNTKTLKFRYLPDDDVEVEDLADELTSRGLVVIYADHEGREYAQVPSFKTHQVINNRESESVLQARVKDASPRVKAEGKEGREGKEGKGRECIPDPDGSGVASFADAVPPIQVKPDCPHQQIIALYHEILPMCPKVRDWTPTRASQLRARWNEDPSRQSLDYWRRYFEYVKTCGFLVGNQPDPRRRPFFADLEWLTKSANFTKVREQKYE